MTKTLKADIYYLDEQLTKFGQSLYNTSSNEPTFLDKTFQNEFDKWKDEDMLWVDPTQIPFVVDSNIKPYNMYMTSSSSPPIKITFSEPKPKTRFEMIIEKK